MRLKAGNPEFFEFLRNGRYSNVQKVVFLLGGVPNDYENSLACSKESGLKKVWQKSLPNIVAFMLRLTSARCAFLREEDAIPPNRIIFPNVPTPSWVGLDAG